MRVLPIAGTSGTHTRARHLQLVLLVVGLVGEEHSNLAPPIEEQSDRSSPHHEHEDHDADLDAADLQ